MTKPIKDKWLGARVDASLEARVSAYIKATGDDELNMGALVRKAITEYMLNHPVKGEAPDETPESVKALAGDK